MYKIEPTKFVGGQASAREKTEGEKKLKYTRPALMVYGSVKDLTRSNGSKFGDGKTTKSQKS